MQKRNFPFAVRLLGFSDAEIGAFDAAFADKTGRTNYRYLRLADGNLRDADLYVAHGSQLRALVMLAHLQPSDVRPALLVGSPPIDLPYPRIEAPIQWPVLMETLDFLVERRFEALSRLQASDRVIVPERRRRMRLDIDLTEPGEYVQRRTKPPRNSMVLVIDRSTVLHDHLGALVQRHGLSVALAGNEKRAIEVCRQQPIAMVMINTSTPGIDPYRLCRVIKAQESAVGSAVIFVVGKSFIYDHQQAHAAGAAGFLTKPLVAHHLLSVVKRFLPLAR